jgi:hypothetical protein
MSKDKPRVLMIGWHTCIRVIKEAKILIDAGYKVDLLTCRLPASYNAFGMVHCYFGKEQFVEALTTIKDRYDIFHVHNEPNVLVMETLKIVDKPVVFDAHDYNLLRVPACCEDEIMSVLYSDAIINVSNGIDDHIRKTYRLDKLGIPSTVIFSACTEDMFLEDVGQKRFDVVYEGGVRNSESTSYFAYRNLEPIIYAFSTHKIPFHIYCKLNEETISRFSAAGAKVHDGIAYQLLLRELAKYKWGWTGFNNDPPKIHIKYAMTNKFFEYMAAGTPVLTYMTEEQNAVVEKYGFGLVIKSLRDMGDQIKNADWEGIHNKMLEHRYEFTMDKQLPKLESIYEQAIAYRAKKDIQDRVDPALVDYLSFQYFPIKPEDWWVNK